eukprot:CAMPEP_0196763306 /NCGR_PEP_ID=MMETSP1095-20130614/3812_1 /TAXON_ID=96789 ORGANISM="Chromulina nebulosa, Strain UTEXLB2642" /NCGR_SAMPLE_ID=MMETSP1095 /ASSEMBLY_ACC=CAM_ASM_000446 /LENGTH=222 /DNA_ID=CAMNT_0042116199 /DNA_START=1024 /DNA_END=1692 /DNA_ORIENTATION=+
MTELSPLATIIRDSVSDVPINEFDKMMVKITGSSGTLVAGCDGKIIDSNTGETLPPTSEGELLVRGPNVMQGYLSNDEATDNIITPDGWLRTGDIGYFNTDGLLFITDRSKELIKYKGYQVPPAELEALIIALPEVKDVIVIPVLDDEAGELPRAYVVLQDNTPEAEYSVIEQKIINYVKDNVSSQKRLRGGVKFTKSIPKSPSGKLLRRIQVQIDRGEISV